MPLDVFHYYKPTKSVYHEVEQSGELDESGEDSKISSTKIKVGTRIGIKGLVKAQIDFVFERIRKTKSKAESTDDIESAATSGDWSSAATSGNGSSAATSGNGSSAATSGYKSSAATSGYKSSAATSNKNGIALACGKNAKAKGVIGSYIVLTEWNENADELICAKMVRIDGETYKPDTWYVIKNGDIVEAE